MSRASPTPSHRLLCLVLLGCLTLWGCDDKTTASDEVKIVAITAPGTPWHDGWLVMQQRLREQHNDLLKPRFYVTGQLGSEESTLSQLRRGRVQLGGFSLQGASSVVPELGLLLAPFLFADHAELDFVMDTVIDTAFRDRFAEKGLVLLGWAEVGWTSLYGKQAILTPQHAAGKKLRSSNALASQLLIQAIGAHQVPLPFPDIMPSLQTGLINGAESGSIFYVLGGVAREAPHLTLTQHAFDTGVYLANKSWYEQLSAQQQFALQQSLLSLPELRRRVRDMERSILAQAADQGIKVHTLTPAQHQQWVNATAANHQRLIDLISGDAATIYQQLMAGKAAYAARQKAVSTP